MNVSQGIRGILAFVLLSLPALYYIADMNKCGHIAEERSILPKDNEGRGSVILVEPFASNSMQKLDWARMKQSEVQHTFTFISGYHDNRTDVPQRPAVVVLTYINVKLSQPQLRCLYTYSSGSKQCLENVVVIEKVDCFASPYTYKDKEFKLLLCSLENASELPAAVQLSSSRYCEESTLSEKIQVRKTDVKKKQHKIGVCLQSSLREESPDIHQMLRNFISMSQFLGASFITMYASPGQVSPRIITDLSTNYSDMVNLVEWRSLKYDYYGQLGLIHDCFYRHTGKAQYLAFIDLDEMILPMRHLNWLEMLEDLERKAGTHYAGYSFLHRLYKRSSQPHPSLSNCSENFTDSVYLTHLDERRCIFKHDSRSKLILSPRHSVHVGVHAVCKLSGDKKLFLVTKNFAINAHYRKKELRLRHCFNYFATNNQRNVQMLLEAYVNKTCH